MNVYNQKLLLLVASSFTLNELALGQDATAEEEPEL
jgi:hypothetical protein